MKKLIIVIASVLLLTSCGNDVKEELNISNNGDEILEGFETKSEEVNELSLSKSEIEGLIKMREEEKLARDVYLYFYKRYEQKIFGNINNAEEKHKSAIFPLLEQFDIEDPIKDDTVGLFTLTEMDKLYKDLIIAGDVSLVEALKIGMTIEDMDIKDLNELIASTKNEDILIVYNNLLQGSHNHLRAFKKNLDKQGGKYIPQFISQEEYNKILGN